MKTIFCALLILMVSLAGCQQKEASNKQPAYPGTPMVDPQQLENLRTLANMNPGKADGWITYGNTLMDSQQFAAAIEAYSKALAIDPKNVDVRVDLGTCNRNVGKPDVAIAEFRKAITLNPNHLNAHRNLGVVLAFDKKDRAGAVKEFQKFLELAPNAPDAAQIKAVIQDLKAGK